MSERRTRKVSLTLSDLADAWSRQAATRAGMSVSAWISHAITRQALHEELPADLDEERRAAHADELERVYADLLEQRGQLGLAPPASHSLMLPVQGEERRRAA